MLHRAFLVPGAPKGKGGDLAPLGQLDHVHDHAMTQGSRWCFFAPEGLRYQPAQKTFMGELSVGPAPLLQVMPKAEASRTG